MQCNTFVAGLVEDNMNSEENDTSGQDDKAEIRMDGLKNDNQSVDQATVASKVAQLESRGAGEQLRLNSNGSENNVRLLPSKISVVFPNRTKSGLTAASDCANSLEQNASQDASNANLSSVFMGTSNIKPQTTNTNVVSIETTCQLKHKTVVNTSALNLPKSQMHLNLSSTQANTHHNHNSTSVSLNSSTATNNSMSHYGVSTSCSLLMPPNLSMIKTNDDIDMKNNVDYASAIEKCPSKVSCSSDSSPEADCSWTSKSYGSKRVLNNIGGSIGSTSQGTCCVLRPNINGSREVAGPSGLQRVGFVHCG